MEESMNVSPILLSLDVAHYSNNDEMKTEEYVEEKPNKKRVSKKKEQPPPPPPIQEEEDEHYMFIREGTRYWCKDIDEKNGVVFENGKDTDGDSAPGKQVGTLKDGELIIDN